MPQTLSAKKALRQDRQRATVNIKTKLALKKALSQARQGKNKASLAKAFSILDQAAKKKVIHKKKANRLKSRLAKLTKKKTSSKPLREKTTSKSSQKRA